MIGETTHLTGTATKHKHGFWGSVIKGCGTGCPCGGAAGCLICLFGLKKGILLSFLEGALPGAALGGILCYLGCKAATKKEYIDIEAPRAQNRM